LFYATCVNVRDTAALCVINDYDYIHSQWNFR